MVGKVWDGLVGETEGWSTNVYSGVVETLLNFLDGSPRYNCVQWSEEDKYLREIGLQCDQIETPDEFF
jgi:hypothetical protein